ncbi:hypothetical protein RHCRD62_20350 [Rhodococcus sp. RD6.2]|nr:hypothetical protein RHCRD62_20350 [Rhodococcus sp. RD6.2]
MAAARELDRDRRGSEDQRRQVRQEAAAVAVPGRRTRRHPDLTARRLPRLTGHGRRRR